MFRNCSRIQEKSFGSFYTLDIEFFSWQFQTFEKLPFHGWIKPFFGNRFETQIYEDPSKEIKTFN